MSLLTGRRPTPPTTEPPTAPAPPSTTRDGRTARWYVPALGALLVATAVLYLVGLSASGWGNAFYAAAAQAGGQPVVAGRAATAQLGQRLVGFLDHLGGRDERLLAPGHFDSSRLPRTAGEKRGLEGHGYTVPSGRSASLELAGGRSASLELGEHGLGRWRHRRRQPPEQLQPAGMDGDRRPDLTDSGFQVTLDGGPKPGPEAQLGIVREQLAGSPVQLRRLLVTSLVDQVIALPG